MQLPSLTLWDDTRQLCAAENMAVDEALALTASLPVLRAYRWGAPAATYGYFADYHQLAGQIAERDHARRLTGGGLVEHGDDLTITMTIPRHGEWRTISSSSVYHWLHTAIMRCLEKSDIQLTLYNGQLTADSSMASNCFTAPVLSDLCHDDKKVGGGAIRRSRDYILYQGSLRPPAAQQINIENLAAQLAAGNPIHDPYDPGEKLHQLAAELVATRYSTADWNYNMSRQRNGQR